MISFSCPACDHLYEVADDRMGTEATCLKCGQRMLVPSPTAGQARLGRPVQDADWHSQPPPPRVAPDPEDEPEPAPEGPKSPSPCYPYWMSDEAMAARRAARRGRTFRYLGCVAAWVVGSFVLGLGLVAFVCAVVGPHRWFN